MSSTRYNPDHLRSLADWPKTAKLREELELAARFGDIQARNDLKSYYQRNFALKVLQYNAMICEFATGVGKTGAAVMAMEAIKGSWLIVHHYHTHKETWESSLGTIKVTYTTYKSLKKHEGSYYTGIVLDEGHHITDKSLFSLTKIFTDYKIVLSGTIPSPKKLMLHQWDNRFKADKINLVKGIQKGLLPAPKIIICPVRLTDDRTEVYNFDRKGPKAGWETITYAQYSMDMSLHKRFKNYHIECSQKEKYDFLCGDIAFWSKLFFEEKEPWQEIRWHRASSDRKQYLASIKQRASKAIHKKFKASGKRFLVFLQEFQYLEALSTINIIHYKNKDNKETLEQFNTGTIDSLYSSEMLNESYNLVNLELVLIGTLNAIQVANFQRLGRSLRGEFPIIVVPFVPGTNDEQNLQKFLKGMEEFVVTAATPGQVEAFLST